jgi:hypothetical protein
MAKKINIKGLTPDYLNGMINESRNHPTRVDYLKNTLICWKHYNARKWLSPDAETDMTDDSEDARYPKNVIASENRIKKAVNDAVSVYLMNRPIVHSQPFSERPQDADLADHMDLMRSALWESDGANIGNVMYSLTQEKCICGLSVGKIIWDPYNQTKGKEGEISGYKVVPDDLFLDPYATNDHRGQDCRYKIHRLWMTPEYIIQKFGSEGEIALGLRAKVGRRSETKSRGFATTALASDSEKGDVDPRVEVYECWLKPIMYVDPEEMLKQKYGGVDLSFGIVVTMINNYIVKIIPNPYAEYRTIPEMDMETGQAVTKRRLIGSLRDPFVFLYHQATSDDRGRNLIYMAQGMVESMIPVQHGYNRTMTSIAINAATTANPAIGVMEDALVGKDVQDITGEPGEIHVINPRYQSVANAIQTLPPGMMPSYVQQLAIDYRNSIQDLGGIAPEMTGQAPTGTSHLPGVALQGLQSASFTPLRTPIEQLDLCIYDISVLCDGLMQLKYKPGRHISVSNQGQRRFLEWTSAHMTAQFSRKVVSGSTTPMGDVDRITRLTQVRQMVIEALATQNPSILKATLITIVGLKDPYSWDMVQLLETEIATLEAQMQGLQDLGMSQMGQQMQGQGQQQDGISQFANMLGIDPSQLNQHLDQIDQMDQEQATG